MEFRVLGTVRLRREGVDTQAAGPVMRTLLAILLSQADEPIPVEKLVDAVWPDTDSAAASNRLHVHISRLRRLLGDPDRLPLEPNGYRLRVLPGELDAERFETLIDEAAGLLADDPARSADLLHRAIDLWHGEPYGDLDVPCLADEARRLSQRWLAAVELRFEAELALGRHAAIIADLSHLTAQYPFRENICALLMTALYRAGRQAEALDAYTEVRRRLAEDLGIAPGPQLQDLHVKILKGEEIELGRATARSPEGRSATPTPAQLPAPPTGFVGRDEELTELDRILLESAADTGSPVAVLAGTAGVGKTALAIRWAHRARDRFVDGQLYLDLRGFGPDPSMSVGDALAGFLRELRCDGRTIPSDPTERAARFRTLTSGKRLLVVLDNADRVEQIRPLIPGGSGSAVLVTSRDTLLGLSIRDQAKVLPLDRLPADAARRLVRSTLDDPSVAQQETVDALVERCARLPLALLIASVQARTRPNILDELTADPATGTDALDLLDVDGDPRTAIRDVFSWSYTRLPESAAILFRLCGLHPTPELHPRALAAMAGLPMNRVRRDIDALVHIHLVERAPDQRLRLHDLLRAYAAELAECVDSEAARAAALDRVLEHYRWTVADAMRRALPYRLLGSVRLADEIYQTGPDITADRADALRWLDRERDALLTIVERVATDRPRDPFPHRLAKLLAPYFGMRGHAEAQRLYRHALTSAKTCGDRESEGRAHHLIGLANAAENRANAAIVEYRRALAIYEELDLDDAQAELLNDLSVPTKQLGFLRSSSRQLQRALAMCRSDTDPELRLRPLNNLASVHARLGDYDLAEFYAEEAIRAAGDSGSRTAQARGLINLGIVHSRTGREARAVELQESALALVREHRLSVIERGLLNDLTESCLAAGEVSQAAAYCRSAMTSAREWADDLQLMRAANGFGEICLARGTPVQAVPWHRIASKAAAEHQVPYQRARAFAGIGRAMVALGRTPAAIEYLAAAEAAYRALEAPEANRIADEVAAVRSAPAHSTPVPAVPDIDVPNIETLGSMDVVDLIQPRSGV